MLIILSFATEGDKEKFEYLYHKYKNLMLYKAYDILKDYRLAEDAASEAFIRIYKNLHKIEDTNSNQTISFLVTIVKNTALTILSKEQKHITDVYDEEMKDQRDLEEYVISELSSEGIFHLINQLNDDLKGVFLLKYAHGMTNKEIASIQMIPEKHVAVKIYRAKKKLSELLIKEGYAHEVG